MSTKLTLELIIFALIIIFLILYITRKGRIIVKYSLVWLVSGTVLLVFALIPNSITKITKLLGFQMTSNLIFSILIGLLIFICISLTIIVSGQKEKIRLLIQEVSILRKEVDDKK